MSIIACIRKNIDNTTGLLRNFFAITMYITVGTASGVSRDFMLVGPLWDLIKVCFSTSKLGGSGGMPPQEIFDKLALTRAILVHFGQ
jgi:hypothetical protein